MEIASFILSVLAILGSGFTYFHHDRRIKIQEKQLNEFQLKKNQTEEIDNQKAKINGNIIKEEQGRRKLIVYNSGKSAAYNIRLEVLSNLNGIIRFDFVPYEMLNPQEKTEMHFFLAEGHVPTLKVKFIWKDNFNDNNEFVQILSIR
jgi:hypothetical protein